MTGVGARIVIENFTFSPANLQVRPGTKVTVVNRDSDAHTVTATGDKIFDTGNITGGATVTFTAPSTPGSYSHLCTLHPNRHHGRETGTSGEALHPTAAVATPDPDSLPEADCWASAPTGTRPVPSAQLASGTTTDPHGALPADGLLNCRAPISPHALGVLRI